MQLVAFPCPVVPPWGGAAGGRTGSVPRAGSISMIGGKWYNKYIGLETPNEKHCERRIEVVDFPYMWEAKTGPLLTIYKTFVIKEMRKATFLIPPSTMTIRVETTAQVFCSYLSFDILIPN